MSSLYQRNLWHKLLKFVRKRYIVHVNIDNKREDCKEFPAAGVIVDAYRYMRKLKEYATTGDDSILRDFKYNSHGKHVICIVHNRHEHQYTLMCVLIHEFGHCLMHSKYSFDQYEKMSDLRRERTAWYLGKRATPKYLRPPEYVFAMVKEQAISSYE